MAGVRALGHWFQSVSWIIGLLAWPAEALGPAALLGSARPPLSQAPVKATPAPGALCGRLDVSAFGAKGDGSTDDTRAIQAAIAAARGGGFVMFPAGTFVVSGTLAVSDQLGLTLVGAGPWATVITPTKALAGAPVIRFTNCRACGAVGSENAGQVRRYVLVTCIW